MNGTIGGLPLHAARRTRFVDILRKTPPRTVCPNFYMLSHANGCAFEPTCDYCYLKSTLWYLDAPRVYTNVDDLLAEVRAWIARDGLESTVLNTGNLSDSLGFEYERPLAARLVELFRWEAELKSRPHTLLLVTKGGSGEIGPLVDTKPSASVIVSFSLNATTAASLHERGAPGIDERLAAARTLKDQGWRIRIRIDPMIAGHAYGELADRVGRLAPERVTLGCLRADRGLLRLGNGVFAELEPISEPGGLARYPLAERIRLYREAIKALAGRSPVGLCEETADIWAAVGLDPESPAVQLRDLSVALVQLPLPDPEPGTAAANVPLAAGCLRSYAAAHGGPPPARIKVLPRSLAGHGGDEAVLTWLAAGGFDVVGFTTHLWSVDRALLLASRLKNQCPKVRLLFGGPEVAPGGPVLASPVVDACVIGEGESAFLDALASLAAEGRPSVSPRKVTAASSRHRAAEPIELSTLPNPYLAGMMERDASDPVYLETVRGCPNRCSYCFYAKEFPGLREWPAGLLEAIFPWAAANAVPEIYLMDPTFNGVLGWEAKLESIAALNDTGIPLHTELRLEFVQQHHAALFRRAGFRSVEAGLQSTNAAALNAVRRTWNRERFLRGAAALQDHGIVVRAGVILGLPGDTAEGFRATIRFLEAAGLAADAEVYQLSVLPGTDLRRDAARLGVVHMDVPPYHVLATPALSADDIAGSIRWLEHELGAEFFAPIVPELRDPAPGLTGLLDLRSPGAIDAARASPERLANRLVVLVGDELLGQQGVLEGFGRWIVRITPSSLVQLVLETDAPLAADRLDSLAEAFHDPAHFLNRERHLDDDAQGRASVRLFRLTRDARAAERGLTAGEACDLILRWPARPAGLARRLLRVRPFLFPDSGLDPWEQREIARYYRGHERLVLSSGRPL